MELDNGVMRVDSQDNNDATVYNIEVTMATPDSGD